ncbi:MAG: ACT domain-containing protein [Gemmatimonadota bacterium]|nr:ACT domain-containing protein [Gemmatimonadota bacterium]
MTELAHDLTVNLEEDRPGALAAVLGVVARAGVNLEGYALIEGLLHFLTKDAATARSALLAAGVHVRRQRDVLVVYAENRVGAAARIFRRIADAGINVHFSYVLADNRVVIGADSLAELARLGLDDAG